MFGDLSFFSADGVGVIITDPGGIMFEISFSFWSSSSLETSATKNQNLESFSKALESTKTYLLKGQYIFLNRQNKR